MTGREENEKKLNKSANNYECLLKRMLIVQEMDMNVCPHRESVGMFGKTTFINDGSVIKADGVIV